MGCQRPISREGDQVKAILTVCVGLHLSIFFITKQYRCPFLFRRKTLCHLKSITVSRKLSPFILIITNCLFFFGILPNRMKSMFKRRNFYYLSFVVIALMFVELRSGGGIRPFSLPPPPPHSNHRRKLKPGLTRLLSRDGHVEFPEN